MLDRPSWWDQAARELARRDSKLAKLIERFRAEELLPSGNAYRALVNAIIGQQISVKAADFIRGRVGKLCPSFEAESILAASPEDLRSCGLSRQKVAYLRGIAEAKQAGQLELSPSQPEAELLGQLTRLHGVGEWTAQMVMIFALGKPDVLPLGDIGILKAAALCYGLDLSLRKRDLVALVAKQAQAWRPWCTLASWYLWRSLDPEPVVY